MSLQFIFGNAGAGKSEYVYRRIIEESRLYPQTNYLVLVPEQFTMQTQKELCMAHPRGGIMNIDVLSFVRLSHRVFEELGKGTRQVLDDEGKNLILRKIAGSCQEELKVFGKNLKKQGYISEVKSVISEFTQYGIKVEELDSLLDTLEPESYLYYKLADIRKVYEGFEQYLADRYITKEELLEVLCTCVPYSNLLKNSVVVLDGFTGFTPVQNRLLGELMKVCKKVFLTVVMEEGEDPFVCRHPYQLFAVSKQTVETLTKIAGEQRTFVEEPVYLYEKPLWRFRENPELGFLESELFRHNKKQFVSEKSDSMDGEAPHYQSVSMHAAKNPREEAEFVASKMRRLVREAGYRYRDMAVIVSDIENYAIHLERACAAYHIPIFMDHKKSILLNAFVEYVRSLLDMMEQNFSYESVFRFLRTGMTGFERGEVDRLENYVLALGIRGYKKWKSQWGQRPRNCEAEELAQLNGLRVRFVEKLDGLVVILRKRKKTVSDITRAVYAFFVQEQVQEQIRERELQFQEEKEFALAKEYSQIYRIVIDLFDKFVELLGEEVVSLQEYCELLDAGLEEAKVGVIPPSLDQVIIGDMERTRLDHLRVLFFMGANDTFLPGKLGKGGLLSERDREQFARRKLSLSPGAKEKTYIQKFYLYLNLTKPSERLYLSCSKVSSDGKALRPAYLMQEVIRLFPGLRIQDEERQSLSEKELTGQIGVMQLAKGIQNRRQGLDAQWKELYSWYRRQEKEGGKEGELKKILDAAFYRREPERLTEKTAQVLFGDSSRISVTRLERFASCAYAHFLTYGLRLCDREIYQFASMDLGNIAHKSMEYFSRKAEAKQMDWGELPEEQRERLIEESVEESIADYGSTVLYSTARNTHLIVRIKNLIRRSVWALTKQMESGDFRPSGYELKFGSGKIDRVDTYEDETSVYVKVTDYKTGRKSFDITAFYHGLQMQLPVYLHAAMELEQEKEQIRCEETGDTEREIIPAGIFYYRMQDPFVEKEEDDRLLETKILKELRLDGLVNADKRVIGHLEKNLNGASYLHPIGKNKDGGMTERSKVLSFEDFLLLLHYTEKKEAELKQRIARGEADAMPYELGDSTGCDYCAYGAICGFDARLDGSVYRKLKKYSKEEILALWKGEENG